jgi:hypothetical protein
MKQIKIIALALLATAGVCAQDELETAKQNMEKLLETKRLISQKEKDRRLGVEFKNLMDPAIESVYRTPYEDFKRTSYTAGRTYGLSLGCNW